MLVGGGHAHLGVLRAFAVNGAPRARISLVSPFPALVYSGMVPGVIAGRYNTAACRIALEPIAARAGVQWVEGHASALDADASSVTVVRRDGTTERMSFDVLSLDVGGAIEPDAIPGASRHALVVRPMERFLRDLNERLDPSQPQPRDAVVIGGGAGGLELALALRQRLGTPARVVVVSGGPPILAAQSASFRQRSMRALARRGISVVAEACVGIGSAQVVLGSGARLDADLAVVATGVTAPRWLGNSGLALDDAGFVATGPTLQSLSHPQVFAAGDVASRADAPHPRSGVYAVRAGPPLAGNLTRAIEGNALEPYRPQRRSLALLSCGDGTAIASWGGWSAEGRAVWRWKDWIDRRFVGGVG